MGAIQHLVTCPPIPQELTLLTQMVHAELRTVALTFGKHPQGTKMPRVHPVVQAIGAEWEAARTENCDPDWDVITSDYITQLCEKMSEDHPNWHPSFTLLNLSLYLDGIEPSKMWWLLEEEEEEEDADIVMLDPASAPSKSLTSLTPPKLSITTGAKGKAPALLPAFGPCSKKWPAPDSPDPIESDDTMPWQTNVPLFHLDRPFRQSRTLETGRGLD
ncbi:hypothetical protein EDB92DRAFT_1817617 [Lactarius akahatsu]|uniref:Uncharacterized protein n=1 Tax=Lactarius akahatsu TaxID=416441 RepID=A0AAD4QC09_9AGAM|nr:hypothetical protein EDB92DRAFT_1817617 [Lactarius akahatsu]